MSSHLLVLLAVLLPCWYVRRCSVKDGMVEINHVGLFTFGFLLYWIMPMVIGVFGLDLAVRAPDIWSSLFRQDLVDSYISVCLCLYLCFFLGDLLGKRLFRYKGSVTPPVPILVLTLVTAVAGALAVYTAATVWDQLLLPYGTNLTFNPARGRVLSYIIVMGVAALMYAVDRPHMPWSKLLKSRYFLPFLTGMSIFLLEGTRLYTASFILIFAVYQSNLRGRFPIRKIVGWTLLYALLFGAVGAWRAQDKLSGAALNVVQESVQPSISLLSYLHSRGIAWTNSPVYLASDFANLVPYLPMPDKASLIKKLPVYSPLGAMNSFVSFNINFGVIGTAIILFFLALGFRYLNSRRSNNLWATIYILCSGWMAFTFFRDPFKISLVKVILQDSILIPVVIVGTGRLLTAACLPLSTSSMEPGLEAR
jgi:hypothetical protein